MLILLNAFVTFHLFRENWSPAQVQNLGDFLMYTEKFPNRSVVTNAASLIDNTNLTMTFTSAPAYTEHKKFEMVREKLLVHRI